jgi:hypothetical protein
MARDRKITEGKSAQERLDNAERFLQHMKRRMNKKVGVSIPPVPVSEFCFQPESDGTLMRYMFPSNGRIESAAIYAENWPSDQKRVSLTADIATENDAFQKFFDLKPIVNVFQVEMDVEPGARFELKLSDPSVEISRIWLAFLYRVDPSKAHLHQILVEKLEENL